jgi:membrane protein DedA with SNARE-associated domain
MLDVAGGVVGATVFGLGLPTAVLLLSLMEAGVPIPIPDDLVMLLIGERVAAGQFSWWGSVLGLEVVAVAGTALVFLAARGPGFGLLRRFGPRLGLTEARLGRAAALIDRRGRLALAIGRATPGLRTVTAVAAGTSGINPRRALPALVVGASVFVQLHLVLGLVLGPLAHDAYEHAKGPTIVVGVILIAAAAAFWLLRRGRHAGAQAFTEAACPVCLSLGLLSEHLPDTAPNTVAS